MAIKEIDEIQFKRPIELLRKDFAEFARSNITVAELVGYEKYNQQTVRYAAIRVAKEYNGEIKFFARNNKFYLSKEQ